MDVLGIYNPFTLEQVEKWFEWGGYFILFGLLFACGLGLPLPEDIPLLLAGYFIANGKMNWALASFLAWAGIIGGDCVLYSLGKKYGLNITRVPFVGKHLTKARILRAEQLFERWGIWVVAVGRLFAGIRGAMVVAAGATRFSFVKFVIADGLAALVSGGMFIALGYWAGKKLGSLGEMRQKMKGVEHYVLLGALAIAVLVVAYLWWRRRHKPIAEVALDRAAEKAAQDLHPSHDPARSDAHGGDALTGASSKGSPNGDGATNARGLSDRPR